MHHRPAYPWRLATTPGLGLCLVSGCVIAAAPATEQQQDGVRIAHAPRQREVVITVGPIPVHAGGEHHQDHRSHSSLVSLPMSGWLRSYEVRIIDQAGGRLPNELLHHLNLIVPDQRELFTPIMRRIGAAGHETGRIGTPVRAGYPITRGDTLLVVAMLHNPTDRLIEEAYAQVRIGYTPADTWLPMLSLYPFYVDVLMEFGPRSFDLPPGRSEVSWEGSPAVPGRILGMGGHLHEHAVLLRFEDVTAGKVMWEARPRFDVHGRVVGMPVEMFLLRLGLPLRPEHTYRLTAIYDNPTGETIRDGGMGVLGGAFVPSRGARWPPVDRADGVYALDRLITVSGPASRPDRGAGDTGHQAGSGAEHQHEPHHH